MTSTPNATAPVRHTVTLALVSQAGPMGRCGDRAPLLTWTIAQLAVPRQPRRELVPDLRRWPGLPWLAAADESGMEPENLYSQGDRPDPLKAG